MSSPYMNNVLLLGCIIAYSTNFLQTFDKSNAALFCKVIKDCELIGIVGLLVVIPLIVLIIWEIIDPQTAMNYEVPDKVS
ncbi:hypothetical protein CHS0354_015677 [Potamilus streckersoni]|uniref:Uncharacterized protein n=1 Tax=Potamilus streckersoni TaxID=2493646 RepID=A0AAE0W1C1_9BIVA|nr:hypothetical protein CHS0354_015677 [Potamilus streckersoni]